MTDLLFNLTIGPLKLIYELLYSGLIALTHHYGWALVLLSFVTTAITIPLGKAVSAHIKKERLIESILDPQIKKIKATSSGAEQSKRIRNLYNRYAYNPLYSIRLAFGVLIQLPFLIGAYWMIAEHPSLSGISFGPIADLSQPDKLLGGINVLPLIMTAANLGVVAISAQMPKRDRIQAIVIAVLFLVLLYSAPSALLIYWTTNNLILFIKSLSSRISIPLDVSFDSSTHNPHNLIVSALYIIAVGCVCSLALFNFNGHEIRLLQGISDFIFMVLLIEGFLNLVNNKQQKPTLLISIVGLIVALIFFKLIGYWFLDTNSRKLISTIFIVIIPTIYLFSHFRLKELLDIFNGITPANNLTAIIISASSVILSIVCVYLPFQIYFSDPLTFELGLDQFTGRFLEYFIVGAVFLLILCICCQRFKKVLSLFLPIVALLVISYTFIIAPDYGVMTTFKLAKPSSLYNKNLNLIADVLTFAGVISLIACAFKFHKQMLVIWIFSITSIFCLSSSIYTYHQLNKNLIHKAEITEHLRIPQKVSDFYSFSKTQKNIVVVMFDMFTGGNVEQILERHPEFKTKFDGFTWYKDSISGGSFTIFGKPGILGGEALTAGNLSKDRTKSLEIKINEGWGSFFRYLQDAHFDIAVHDYTWLKPEIVSKKLDKPANLINSLLVWDELPEYWSQKNRFSVNFSENPTGSILAISLFRTIPLSVKKYFYQNGSWLNTINPANWHITHALRWIAHVEGYPDLSNLNSKTPTFKFMINDLTHTPWSLNKVCRPSPIGFYENSPRRKDGAIDAHLNNEACALLSLTKWIDWMKANGIYDNTMIIFVSDHGCRDSSDLFKTWNCEYPIRLHSLLLVKDFNQKGPLKIDTTSLTANWDVPQMIKNSIGPRSEINLPWKDPKRVRRSYEGEWQRTRHPDTHYITPIRYEIKGSLFNKNHWSKIDD